MSLGRGLPRGSTRPRDGHIVLPLTSGMRHVRAFPQKRRHPFVRLPRYGVQVSNGS